MASVLPSQRAVPPTTTLARCRDQGPIADIILRISRTRTKRPTGQHDALAGNRAALFAPEAACESPSGVPAENLQAVAISSQSSGEREVSWSAHHVAISLVAWRGDRPLWRISMKVQPRHSHIGFRIRLDEMIERARALGQNAINEGIDEVLARNAQRVAAARAQADTEWLIRALRRGQMR